LDIGETLSAQQLFGDPLRAPASARDLRNSDARRLRQRLGGECLGSQTEKRRTSDNSKVG
jgi:hypothetical protein